MAKPGCNKHKFEGDFSQIHPNRASFEAPFEVDTRVYDLRAHLSTLCGSNLFNLEPF